MKPAIDEPPIEEEESEADDVPTAMAQAFQRAMQGGLVNEARGDGRESSRPHHRRAQDDILERTLRGVKT